MINFLKWFDNILDRTKKKKRKVRRHVIDLGKLPIELSRDTDGAKRARDTYLIAPLAAFDEVEIIIDHWSFTAVSWINAFFSDIPNEHRSKIIISSELKSIKIIANEIVKGDKYSKQTGNM